MNKAVLHYYKYFRRHQMETYGNSGLWINGVDQREFTGGGAVYGEHAFSAYNSAKRQINFRKNLKAYVAKSKKRSKVAKRRALVREAA